MGPNDEIAVEQTRNALPVVIEVQPSTRSAQFLCGYFQQLELEFAMLCPEEFQHEAAPRFDALRKQQAEEPSWNTVNALEMLVLSGLRGGMLPQRLALYRETLESLIGSVRAATLTQALAPAEPTSIDAQRDFALSLLTEIQGLRQCHSEFEALRTRLYVVVAIFMIALIAVTCAWIHRTASAELPAPWVPPSVYIMVAGFTGSLFSVLVKLGRLNFRSYHMANCQLMDRLDFNIIGAVVISLIEGAIGALILQYIFSARLFDNSLFPRFNSADIRDADLIGIFWSAPSTTIECAKLFVWCVLAGYCERFIPDFLSRLIDSAKPAKPLGT